MSSLLLRSTKPLETMLVLIVSIMACGFEICFSLMLLYGNFFGIEWTEALVIHINASMLTALVGPYFLPAHYEKDGVILNIFFFILILFIPLLGMLGLILAILPGLHFTRTNKISFPVKFNKIRPLPSSAPEISIRPVNSIVDVNSCLNSRNPEVRLKAIIASLKLKDKDAIPLLLKALRDTEDDIRLLAYSLLDRKEQAISNRIQSQLKNLENSTKPLGSLFYKRIANEYWELVHLGLVQGEGADIMLNNAYKYNKIGLKLCPEDAGLHFQVARILLRIKNLKEAEDELKLAEKYGFDRKKLLPYFAEINYSRKQFMNAKKLMREIKLSTAHPTLATSVEFWNKDHS